MTPRTGEMGPYYLKGSHRLAVPLLIPLLILRDYENLPRAEDSRPSCP